MKRTIFFIIFVIGYLLKPTASQSPEDYCVTDGDKVCVNCITTGICDNSTGSFTIIDKTQCDYGAGEYCDNTLSDNFIGICSRYSPNSSTCVCGNLTCVQDPNNKNTYTNCDDIGTPLECDSDRVITSSCTCSENLISSSTSTTDESTKTSTDESSTSSTDKSTLSTDDSTTTSTDESTTTSTYESTTKSTDKSTTNKSTTTSATTTATTEELTSTTTPTTTATAEESTSTTAPTTTMELTTTLPTTTAAVESTTTTTPTTTMELTTTPPTTTAAEESTTTTTPTTTMELTTTPPTTTAAVKSTTTTTPTTTMELTTTPQEIICPDDCPFADDPTDDCSKYYQCTTDGNILYLCPDTFCFNQDACQCLPGGSTTPLTCPDDCPLVDDPNDDCSNYYSCANGDLILYTCPTEKCFDQNSCGCIDSSSQTSTTSTTRTSTTTTLTTSTTSVTPTCTTDCPFMEITDDNCQNFYICGDNGDLTPAACPGTLCFDQELCQCVA